MSPINTMSPTEWYTHHSKPLNLNTSSLLSPPPNSLSDFSDLINRLATTISSTSTPTDSSHDSYLNSTISLLNMCNTVSARIEKLRLGCLRLKFAHHLLSTTLSTDRLSCARKELSEWEMHSKDTNSGLYLAYVEELEKTNIAVARLCAAIDSAEIVNEELRIAAVEVKVSAEELTVGLDRLAASVNNLFSLVMHSRNVVLDSYSSRDDN